MSRKKISIEDVVKKAKEGGFSTLSGVDSGPYKISEAKPKRMVLCWKCARGILVKDQMRCEKSGMLVLDFKNPPDGCPVKTRWQEEDANERA